MTGPEALALASEKGKGAEFISKPKIEVNKLGYSLPETIDPDWFSGFFNAEGSLIINLSKGTTSTGYSVSLRFEITQSNRDKELLQKFFYIFKKGKVYEKSDNPNCSCFIISDFKVIYNSVIPFFKNYPLHGVKSLDYKDFTTAAILIENKEHLTRVGLEKIIKIRNGMNSKRFLESELQSLSHPHPSTNSPLDTGESVLRGFNKDKSTAVKEEKEDHHQNFTDLIDRRTGIPHRAENLKKRSMHTYRESSLMDNFKSVQSIKITEGCEAIMVSGEGVRFAIKQSDIHKDYLFFLYNFFFSRGYTSNLAPRLYKRTIKGRNNVYHGYEFNTYTFRSFVWLYELFYKKGKKIVPKNINDLLTPLALAIFVMCNGEKKNNGMIIDTYLFTKSEVQNLVFVLKDKFNINSSIFSRSERSGSDKNKYKIFIYNENITILVKIIEPFLHSSMHYKIFSNLTLPLSKQPSSKT
uniref:LAGLIDADG homing endonuclease n=1 Tax=Elmerina hispida TaxID=1245649 RepID=UPI003002C126|nr:LAGLIDADG homing endonuclease [Elmerina hispida]